MNKETLIERICKSEWISSRVIARIVERVFDEILASLARGERVNITGFGAFELKKRAPRTGRNPHANVPVHIPARVVPVFRPAKKMKDAVIKEV